MASSPLEIAPKPLTPARVIARVITSIVGGWVFVWGFIAGGIPLLVRAGMPFDEARNLTHLLAFIVYLAVACWAFAAASLARVAAVLFGDGIALTALSWLLTRSNG